MWESFRTWLETEGIGAANAVMLVNTAKLFLLILLAGLSDRLAKKLLIAGLGTLASQTKNTWDDDLAKKNVFSRLAHIAPAAVIYAGIDYFFPARDTLVSVIQKLAAVFMLFMGMRVFSAVLDVFLESYEKREISRSRPIKGYLQILVLILYFLCGVFSLGILLNRSPWGFFTVMGGLTAVLLLVFKDTILGFVASIQLVANNMVRRGDWIEMPKYGADGDVIDVSITTVKVRNWDKTITTIPTYSLVSDSFKNWRGMTESGGRRIKRSVNIDMTSVRFCDALMIEKFRKYGIIQEYIEKKQAELKAYNQEHQVDETILVNGRRLTNLGTFRAYVTEYLKRHPKIHQDLTFLVRQLQPTEYGIPIEIYVFSNDQAWANYEAIQADIFDHILAVIPEFGLRVFQNPTGADFAGLVQRESVKP